MQNNSKPQNKFSKKVSPIKFISKGKNALEKIVQTNESNSKTDHFIHKINEPNTCPSNNNSGYDIPNILGLVRVKPCKSVQLDHPKPVPVKEISENTDTTKDNHDSFESKSTLEANVANKLKMSNLSQSVRYSEANSECEELNERNTLSSTINFINMSTSSELTEICPSNVTGKINASITVSESNPDCKQIVETSSIRSINHSKCNELNSGIYLNDNIIASSNTENENMPRTTNIFENKQNITEMESVKSYCVNNSSLILDNTILNSYCSNSTITNKNMFDRNYLDFGDHELFCESCDDFHPHHKGTHLVTCKQNKNVDSLLNCVLDKKDSTIVTNQIVVNKKLTHTMVEVVREKGLNDAEELNKSSLMLSKGKRYKVQFKTKVVSYALKHNAKQAAHMFKVNRGTVSAWLTENKRCNSCSSSNPIIVEVMCIFSNNILLIRTTIIHCICNLENTCS